MTDTEREETLERLMDDYGTEVKRLCTLQLRDAAQAEDASQEVFIKAWRALDSFRNDCGERAWLMRIAVNTCRDHWRTAWLKNSGRRISADALETRAYEDEYKDGTVSQAIKSLPYKIRMAVLLRYYQALTIAEVASAMNVSPATVKRQLSKANKLLRPKLERWYFNE